MQALWKHEYRTHTHSSLKSTAPKNQPTIHSPLNDEPVQTQSQRAMTNHNIQSTKGRLQHMRRSVVGLVQHFLVTHILQAGQGSKEETQITSIHEKAQTNHSINK